MKRRFIGFIVLLALITSARGQTAYSYRYWYDNDLETVQEGTANGETTIEIDIGALEKGSVHAVHLQGLDARNKWSAVRTQYFFLVKESTIESVNARYWLDNDETAVQTTSTVNGIINLDTDGLDAGVHSVHYQTFNSEGKASPVHTQYFFIAKEGDKKSVTARYWFDNNTETVLTAPTINGTIDLDITELNVGIHSVHYQTFNMSSEASPVQTQYFYKKNEVLRDNLLCKIWIDNEEDKALNFGFLDDIVIQAEDLSAGTHDLHVVVLNAAGEQLAERTTTFEVDELRRISITLKAPITTFSSDKDLDFYGVTGFRAYTATGFHRWTGNVLMNPVEEAQAGEGLLLVGEPGTYEVTVRKTYTYYSNLLVGTPETTVIARTSDGYDNYMLSFRDGEAGFYLVEDGSTSAAGKAYLHIPSDEVAGAQKLRIIFGESPDGVVSPFEETEEGAIYNLAGQRLNKLQKGINIKDGKKVIVK